jgi:hypothetical protein
MENSWTQKPAAALRSPKKKPHPSTEQAELEQDAVDAVEVQAKLERSKKVDQIAEIVGGTWFITSWTDPILNVPSVGQQMSVSRFYPTSFVAVDIFTNIGEHEKRIIEAKRKAFKENKVTYGNEKRKVRYGALSWADPLANLMPQLEE